MDYELKSFLKDFSYKRFIRGKILLGILLFLSSSYVSAQGTLIGKVTDKAGGNPLVAATITLKGTTVGTVADQNGNYILTCRPGTYTVHASYIGYEDFEQVVELKNNQTLNLDIMIGAVAIQGEEAVITMQARGQLAAVNQQLRSNQIINVVSAERIRELPDENAAQAISRLPGIHLSGSKIVIRGLEPKLNKILINGVEMPSTESETRATDLGMISANMLSGIEVYKTLTPDMDADAVGGVVNLRLREAKEGFHYTVTGQGNYNQQEQFMGNMKLWGDISNRFLDNRLGVLLNLNYEKSKKSTDRYTKSFTNISNSTEFWDGEYIYSALNVYDDLKNTENLGASLVVDFDLPKGQLVYSGMMTHTTSDATEYREAMAFRDLYQQYYLERNGYKRMLLNNSLRYEQQLGIVSLDASVSNVSINKKDDFNYNFRFGTSSNCFYPDSVTDNRLRTADTWDPYSWMIPDAIDLFTSNYCSMNPGQFSEDQWLADFNVKIPVRFSQNINMDLKMGGKYKRKDRDRDMQGYEYNYIVMEDVNASILPWLQESGFTGTPASAMPASLFADSDYQPNGNFMNGEDARFNYVIDADLADEMFLNQIDRNSETTLLWDNTGRLINDYWGFETYTAAYLMGELNLGRRLVLIPGLRYERVHNEYTAYKVHVTSMSFWPTDTLTKPVDHEHFLPHLHLRFRATDWWDIRLSYNKTLSRPDYNYALPGVWYHTSQSRGTAGNPFIKPADSENYDANFTFYAKKLGLFNVGGFYKTITNMFYEQETIVKNIPDSSVVAEFPLETYPSIGTSTTDYFVNSPYKGYVKGLEVEWQSNLSWLPKPFNGLVLNANYTHVWSESKYLLHRVLFVVPPGGWLAEPVESDTFYINRLLHQADNIFNASLGYDYKGFSARFSFRYQGNVVSAVRSLPQLNGYTSPSYKFDLAMKQRIPLKFADLEIFLNAMNFTNVPNSSYIHYPGGKETTSISFTGRQFQLGIRLLN